MEKSFAGGQRLSFRVLAGILLTVYLYIFPAVIYCNLHCEIDSDNIASANPEHDHVIHTHNHGQPDPAPQPSPLHKDKGAKDKYSFCLFVQSVPSVGIFSNPVHITGIFETTERPLFAYEEGISQTIYTDVHNRAPPVVSLV